MDRTDAMTKLDNPTVRQLIANWFDGRPGFPSPEVVDPTVLTEAVEGWRSLGRANTTIPLPRSWLINLPNALRNDPIAYLLDMSRMPAPYWKAMADAVRTALEPTDQPVADAVEQLQPGDLDYRGDLRITLALTGIDQYPEGIWNALRAATQRELKHRAREFSTADDRHCRIDGNALNCLDEAIRLYRAVQDGYGRFEAFMQGEHAEEGESEGDTPPF